MTQPNGSDKPFEEFEQVLLGLLREKGIDLPSIPPTTGRAAYLEFLLDMGYREDDVLPVFDRARATPEMYAATLMALLQALNSDDPQALRAVGWMALNLTAGRDNANMVIYEIAQRLISDLHITRGVPPCYAGVFPTDSFNAQCRLFKGESLILIDTGCIEMCEAAVVTFLSQAEDNRRMDDLAAAVDGYVVRRQRADVMALGTDGLTGVMPVAGVLLNSAEDFVIAHELAHLILGHIPDAPVRRQVRRNGQDIAVIGKSEFAEFQADAWACRALIERALRNARSEADVAAAVAGPMVVLSLALLIDSARSHHGVRVADGHPPAAERLYLIQILLMVLKVHRLGGVGFRFRDFAEAIGKRRYPGLVMPPLFSLELNEKLLPILDSLEIDYRNIPSVHDATET